jgi:hypothetical protein
MTIANRVARYALCHPATACVAFPPWRSALMRHQCAAPLCKTGLSYSATRMSTPRSHAPNRPRGAVDLLRRPTCAHPRVKVRIGHLVAPSRRRTQKRRRLGFACRGEGERPPLRRMIGRHHEGSFVIGRCVRHQEDPSHRLTRGDGKPPANAAIAHFLRKVRSGRVCPAAHRERHTRTRERAERTPSAGTPERNL